MKLLDRLHAHGHPTHGAPWWVRNYDAMWRVLTFGRRDLIHGGTLDVVDFQPGHRLLDIGCGTGELIFLAESRAGGNGAFVGLDVEALMLSNARTKATARKSKATFAEGGIEAIPHPDDAFDRITSSLMLHHVPPELHEAGFAELYRVLKPGGRLAIVDFNAVQPSVVTRLHGRGRLAEDDSVQGTLPAQLEAAGFEIATTGRHNYKVLSYLIAVKP